VFTLPELASLQASAGPTLLISFIGMVQCITMAQALAAKRRERIDANRELTGLGAANIAAAFSGGMPVGGGLSRSAINVAAGAQTPLAGVVSGLSMVILVLVGTEWLAELPAGSVGCQHCGGRLGDDRCASAAPSLGLRPRRCHCVAGYRSGGYHPQAWRQE